jgi:hypothetical protein
MICQQETFDGKHVGCLDIAGDARGWCIGQRHSFLLPVGIHGEELFVIIAVIAVPGASSSLR